MLDLVMRLGLEDRMLKNIASDELERVFAREQDMDRLNQRIAELREESDRYLRQAINNITQ